MKSRNRTTIQKSFALLGLIAALAVPTSACGAANVSRKSAVAPEGGLYNQSSAPAPAAPPRAQTDKPADADGASSGGAQNQPAAPRLIIRNADMTIVVSNTQAQLDAINQIATDYKGYVVSSSTSKMGQDLQASVTLRVESAQLDAAMERIRKLAVEVRNENVRGDDVTAEYIDLESNLKNLEAAEAQLQEILKKAEKTEDVMTVFRQLTEIRGQIDQIKGRMKYLSQSAALATINLTLIPDRAAQPVEVAGWRPSGVAKDALEALISALQGLVDVAIWLVILVLPVLIIIAIPFVLLFLLARRILRNRRRNKPVAATAPLIPATPETKE